MPSIDFGGHARGVALFAFLGFAIAGCAGNSYDTDPSALSRQMFEAGFEDIEQVYIDKPDIGTLALAGMQQLSTIDSDVTTRRTGDKIELLLKNQIAYSQTVDADYDAEDWGDLTADMLTEATADSEKIKTAPTEKVYEAMFSGVVGKLDQFSRYAGAQNARENRAARDGFGGIGVRISVEDDEVRVISVMHYTPAEDWSLPRPGLDSAFHPAVIAPELDFLSIHLYPEKDKVNDALDTLRAFQVGKPVVIEETFPLKCSAEEFDDFFRRAQPHAAGWMGFYWGRTPEECRRSRELTDAFMLGWLEWFQKVLADGHRFPTR